MRYFLIYVTAGGERTVRFFQEPGRALAELDKLDRAPVGPPIWALVLAMQTRAPFLTSLLKLKGELP